MWIILFFIATIIFVFTLFFADGAERAVVQSLLMGAVVSVIVALLLLLQALDNLFHAGVGGSTRLPWRERCDSWTGYWSPAVRC